VVLLSLSFSAALQTGELGPVLAQFGLPEEAVTAANEGDIQAFAQAMEKHYKKKSSDDTMDTD
jgi:26S proteasome regulatory subunit N13